MQLLHRPLGEAAALTPGTPLVRQVAQDHGHNSEMRLLPCWLANLGVFVKGECVRVGVAARPRSWQ